MDSAGVARRDGGRPVYNRPAGDQNNELGDLDLFRDTAAADQRLQELEGHH